MQKILGGALILLALVLGGYAWILSQQMASKQREAEAQMQPVVVAATRIPAGSTITLEMVRLAMFPTRPDGSYPDLKDVAGKNTASDIAVGEPLIQERLEGSRQAMLNKLDAGERAVAVKVDEVIAVGNRLSPGDWVDVFVTLRRNNDEVSDTQSRRVLEKLKVLAFGTKDVAATKPGATPGQHAVNTDIPKTAVLAVKLQDVDKLALAAESGRLLLALRPQESKSEGADTTGLTAAATSTAAEPTPAITLKELVGSPRPSNGNTGGLLRAGARQPADAVPTGKAVAVMHGLKEKTVYLSTKNIEGRQ